MEVMNRRLASLSVDDYIVVMFCPQEMAKMYIAQITEKEPSVEANFATRIGSAYTFHWLNVEYNRIVNIEEVYQFLPPQFLTGRGD